MHYWLLKTEPTSYSIENLAKDKETLWEGVRNYQARNFLVSMEIDDKVLIYHSNTDLIGIVGTGIVSGVAEPDPLQFIENSEYYDSKSLKENPRWMAPRIKFSIMFSRCLTREQLRADKILSSMKVLSPGNRLSVIPVTAKEYNRVMDVALD